MNRCNPQMSHPIGNPCWNPGRKKQDLSWFTPLFLLVLICVSIFFVTTFRVSYQQKTEQLSREIQKMKARGNKLDREIANLKIRREQLCSWNFIGKKVGDCKLGLRQAEPGQIRSMVMNGGKSVRSSASVQSRPAQSGRRTM